MAATLVDPSGRASEMAVAVVARPDPVAPGGMVTLTVRPASGGGWEAAPPITVHLPPGAAQARAKSAGWVCQPDASTGDAAQAGAHADVSCLSALAGRTPGLILTFDAPPTPGTIRTCVTAGRPGRPASPTCTESTVQ
jgi:hypothetical protein